MVLDGPGGKKYALHFWHGPNMLPPRGPKLKARQNKRRPWQTVATIHVSPCATHNRPCGTESAVSGVAECSASDEFNAPKGRLLALTRAMEKLGLEREERAVIWRSYFAKINRPGLIQELDARLRGKRGAV